MVNRNPPRESLGRLRVMAAASVSSWLQRFASRNGGDVESLFAEELDGKLKRVLGVGGCGGWGWGVSGRGWGG